jgi:hypothetical protein
MIRLHDGVASNRNRRARRSGERGTVTQRSASSPSVSALSLCRLGRMVTEGDPSYLSFSTQIAPGKYNQVGNIAPMPPPRPRGTSGTRRLS